MEIIHPCGCLIVHGNLNGTAEHVDRMCLRHYEEWRKLKDIYPDPVLYAANAIVPKGWEELIRRDE